MGGDSPAARLGQASQAEAARDRALEVGGTSGDLQFGLATLAGARGRADGAYQHLKTAIERGYRNYIWMKVHTDLAKFAGIPPFRPLFDSLLHVPEADQSGSR